MPWTNAAAGVPKDDLIRRKILIGHDHLTFGCYRCGRVFDRLDDLFGHVQVRHGEYGSKAAE